MTEKPAEKHDYIYANNKLWCEIATKGSTKKTYYHHTDHLGTTLCITDSTGKVVCECTESAFGDIIKNTNNNFTSNFTGKFLDEDTGLYYFNARWYDSEIGQFVTEDPARDGVNWYAYCNGNPLINIDPDGLIVDSVWDGISLGTGVISLVADIKAGNTKAIVIDSLGIVAGAMTVSDGIENGSGLEVASGALQVLGGLSSATGLVSRCSKEAKAKNFYKESGFNTQKTKDHMRGIDFNKDVKVTTLKKGTKVDQWQVKGKPQGDYYTKPGTSPNTLGIDSTDRIKTEYIVNNDTKVLKSTAADTIRDRKVDYLPAKGKGGGTQYFSTEKSNFYSKR